MANEPLSARHAPMREYIDRLSRELEALRGAPKEKPRSESVPPPASPPKWLVPLVFLLSTASAAVYLWFASKNGNGVIPLPFSEIVRH